MRLNELGKNQAILNASFAEGLAESILLFLSVSSEKGVLILLSSIGYAKHAMHLPKKNLKS
jgi:hypothetical protein